MENSVSKHISSLTVEYELANLKQLVFEVTDGCNLKCRYCGYGEFYDKCDDRNNQLLPVEKAFILLDYLKEFWSSEKNRSYSQKIDIAFYGGEPLLNIDFIKKVVYYVEKLQVPSKRFTFSMTTNAVLLDRYIDYLIDKDFHLLISLDGDENGNSYRVDHSGKNSFKRVFDNTRKVQQKHSAFFESNINFNSVLHNRNTVDETYQFIKKEFGKIPRIAELNTVGIHREKEEIFWETYRNKYESLHQSPNYEEMQEDMFYNAPDTQRLGLFLHQYSGNVYQNHKDLLMDKIHKKQYPTGTCLPFSRKLFVTVNGKILPCERIGHQFGLGKVTNKRVILDFKTIAEKYSIWFNKLAPQCNQCYNLIGCVQCVFDLDNVEGNPRCNSYMNKKAFDYYTNARMEYLAKYPHLYEKIMNELILK
jgi:uncharacterized protein